MTPTAASPGLVIANIIIIINISQQFDISGVVGVDTIKIVIFIITIPAVAIAVLITAITAIVTSIMMSVINIYQHTERRDDRQFGGLST
eukprot:scaffold536904_cov20-Prasinocladus_malaysianus.AAC.1